MKYLKKSMVAMFTAAAIGAASIPACAAAPELSAAVISGEDPLSLLYSLLSEETIKEIQAKLNEMGYNCGEVDGIVGPKTIEAGLRFLEAEGISVNGGVTLDTVNQAAKLLEEKTGVKISLPFGEGSADGLKNILDLLNRFLSRKS